MLTYLARPRGLYKEPENAALHFPCRVEAVFRFQPTAPFGGEGPLGRVVPRGARVRLGWDARKGQTSITSDRRLAPVNVDVKAHDVSVHFKGPSMMVRARCESRAELQSLLETYCYALPAILSLDFPDAPLVSEVHGKVGKVRFSWELLDSGWWHFEPVTKELQEKRIATACERLRLLSAGQDRSNLRLLAATEYLHVACHLTRAENRRWGFLAESLLNYAKILEVLFPGPPEKTADTVRAALTRLGFESIEIEALYIPAIVLRDHIDGAQPTLAALPGKDAATLYRYADSAEQSFRELLRRLFDQLEGGKLALAPVPSSAPSRDLQHAVERLSESLRRYEESRFRTIGSSL